jgi:hypothetical protein
MLLRVHRIVNWQRNEQDKTHDQAYDDPGQQIYG